MQGHIFNLPNALSFLRILLIPWFLWFFHTGKTDIAIVIMIVAVLSDWFDGQAARWTNEVSEMGKILDPLADKLCLASVALYFLWIGALPLWFVLFAVLRDLFIFAGAAWVRHHHQVVTTSLWPGKWAVGFVSMLFISMVWPHPLFTAWPVKEFFLYLSTIMLLYSFILYCIRFYRIHHGLDYKA
ncbi:MAG: CDP-alcohol phosphatidyltransferase [Pelodictyon luteolum]|uniref:CDP-diacylglycerol--glycerol-3-phosphate 3-phosphatidyltransferase n=1 Tax=Pelodictyon luteolum TaxID=1100 RepID=A0A165LJ84_PELLU|nr:CDP-alcohol phosphatidyltransferase family protein [Pelodictyon luteolum]KZK74112.1 MAG: CDP-alcohol phosphatidyltransferase [Pelodictyon luteolum]